MMLLGFLSAALASTLSTSPPQSAPVVFIKHTVTIDVHVCEGKEFKFWFNEDVPVNQNKCLHPLKGIPVVAARDRDKTRPIETNAAGNARLGPISLAGSEKFRIAVACTTHRCLTLSDLFVGRGLLEDGNNKLLVVTVPNEQKPASGSPTKVSVGG